MRSGVVACVLLLCAACRPGKGERCFCEGECRTGFVCAAEGAVLGAGQCVNDVSDDIESGTCVEAGNVEGGDDGLTPPPVFDLGGWATDPPVTTLPGTDDSMGTTLESTTDVSSSSGSSSSSSSTATDTDTTDSSSSSSGSSSSSSSSSSGTAGM